MIRCQQVAYLVGISAELYSRYSDGEAGSALVTLFCYPPEQPRDGARYGSKVCGGVRSPQHCKGFT